GIRDCHVTGVQTCALPISIHLFPEFFTAAERPFFQRGELSASLFRCPSGVAALRLSNDRGELVMLPFQGQQIWSAVFEGRNITKIGRASCRERVEIAVGGV